MDEVNSLSQGCGGKRTMLGRLAGRGGTYLQTNTIGGAIKVCLRDELLDSVQDLLERCALSHPCLEHG